MNMPSLSDSRVLRWNILAAVVIIALNWYVFASLGIGLVLIAPIMLSSLSRRERDTWIVSTVSITGYLLTTALTRPPAGWGVLWVPNLVLESATLFAATAGSLVLHRQRMQLERNEMHSRRSDELGRLLITLFAHDVRTPIMSALQGFEYVSACLSDGERPDPALLLQLRDRLRRHLLVADSILSIVRSAENDHEASDDFNRVSVDLADRLTHDIRAFAAEADARGMRLLIDLRHLEGRLFRTDFLVLRQALSVVLDNAIRYANPGFIRITGWEEQASLIIEVEDRGPGLPQEGDHGAAHGMGVALQLSRMLLERVGGRLEVAQTGPHGTRLVLVVPAEVAVAA